MMFSLKHFPRETTPRWIQVEHFPEMHGLRRLWEWCNKALAVDAACLAPCAHCLQNSAASSKKAKNGGKGESTASPLLLRKPACLCHNLTSCSLPELDMEVPPRAQGSRTSPETSFSPVLHHFCLPWKYLSTWG